MNDSRYLKEAVVKAKRQIRYEAIREHPECLLIFAIWIAITVIFCGGTYAVLVACKTVPADVAWGSVLVGLWLIATALLAAGAYSIWTEA